VVHDHHVDRQPRGAPGRGLAQRPDQAHAIRGSRPDQLDVHFPS
jgi:hypothetical protein